MARGIDEPLFTSETLKDINARLAELDKLDLLIDQAVRGGIDMTSQKEESAKTRKKLLQFKQAFFPGK